MTEVCSEALSTPADATALLLGVKLTDCDRRCMARCMIMRSDA